MLGGLGVQLIAFLFFTAIVVSFFLRLWQASPGKVARSKGLGWYSDDVFLVWGLLISCLAIVVCSLLSRICPPC